MSRYSDPTTPCGLCGDTPTRWIAAGPRCRPHWPEQPKPDPARTMRALQAQITPPERRGSTEGAAQPDPAHHVPPDALRAVRRAEARAAAATEKRLKHGRAPSFDPPDRYALGE